LASGRTPATATAIREYKAPKRITRDKALHHLAVTISPVTPGMLPIGAACRAEKEHALANRKVRRSGFRSRPPGHPQMLSVGRAAGGKATALPG